jgi:hypothetical protein
MTLRMEQVARQLPGILERYAAGLESMREGIERASQAMNDWSENEVECDGRIEAVMKESAHPYALSFGERPGATFAPSSFEAATVVAADGSSIDPDRYAAMGCYVINTGYVALPYSVDCQPVLGATAHVGPEGGQEPDVSAGGVNLLRDVRELETGVELACARTKAGPVVLLLDGNLLPWDLDSPRIDQDIRANLGLRTQEALDRLREAPGLLCVGAYTSTSRSRDIVTSLRALSGNETTLWPHSDAHYLASVLSDGERSAVFRAQSQRNKRAEDLFSKAQQACFFYVRIGDDIARVEFPLWAADPERVALLHSTIVDQCARCNGYPRALQEAHEQAVISGGDRQQFSILLENEARRHRLRTGANNKSMSKRRRAL